MIIQEEYVSEYDRVETNVKGVQEQLKMDPNTPFEEFMPHVLQMRFRRQVGQICAKTLRIIKRQRGRRTQPLEGAE